jgi:hypothetical protein
MLLVLVVVGDAGSVCLDERSAAEMAVDGQADRREVAEELLSSAMLSRIGLRK